MLQSRRRLLAAVGFSAILAAILAMGWVSHSELSALADSSAHVQRSYDLLQTLDDLNSALTDTETNQRGYLLTQDPAYLTQYDDAIAQIRLALTELRRLSADEPSTANAVEHLAQVATSKLDDLHVSVLAAQTGKRHLALATVAEGKGKRLMETFQRDSADLETMQRQLLDRRRQEERQARIYSEAVLVTAIILSLLLVGVAAVISRRFDERRRLLESEIAERRRSEEYREQLLLSERTARQEAERATQLKDEFVATLSHELRTPLNAIVGWSSILARNRTAEVVDQGVEVIERNAKLQAQMIEDLLDMSRIVSGKLLFELQQVNVASAVQAAAEAVLPAADAKQVTLSMDIQSCRAVNADPARLQQVIWNLLTNAIKFTPRQGRVDVQLCEVDGGAQITVKDTGEGIKSDFLPFVFDRFRQGDASTTRRHGGLGLGLSIVKSLVEMHDGTVDVQSAGPGQGASFSVRLPIAAASIHHTPVLDVQETAVPAQPNASLTGLRILVVDDEMDARRLAQRVLEECGAVVVTAASTAEALASVDGNNVLSVIVSDIGMPDQDGYDLIRQMRARPGEAGRVPAVALTALARADDRKRALLAGYQTHLSKPVDPAELVAVVANLTGRTTRAGGTRC